MAAAKKQKGAMEKPILNSIKLNKDMTLTISNFPGVKEDVEEFWDYAGSFDTGIVSAYEEGNYLAYDGYFYNLPPNFFYDIQKGEVTLTRAHSVKDAQNIGYKQWYFNEVPDSELAIRIQDGVIVDVQALDCRYGDLHYVVVDTSKPEVFVDRFAVNGSIENTEHMTHDQTLNVKALDLYGSLHYKITEAAKANTRLLLLYLGLRGELVYDKDADSFPLFDGQTISSVSAGDGCITIFISDGAGMHTYNIPNQIFTSIVNG